MQTRDRVGQQFGNYRLVRLIGSGGYAQVYLAEHVDINNLQRAIKVLTGTNLRDKQRAQFLTEARTIANLQSHNSHIVQIHDFGIQTSKNAEDDGVPYLVMEYAAGGTLRDLYPDNTQVPLERIAFYTNQAAEALQCAHDQNPPILHLDIKPENMLLRNHDHLLLSDFGIAITGNTNSLVIPMKEKEITGTVTYMAPERLSKRTRRASDQYALAVVVYEWLCGSPPFDGTDKEILYKHLITPPPPLYPQYSHITLEIENVVMRALAKEPEDRYPTVQEFARALGDAIQKALLQNQPTQPPLFLQAALPLQAPPPAAQPSITPIQDMSQTIVSSPIQKVTQPIRTPPVQDMSQTIWSPPIQDMSQTIVSTPAKNDSQTITPPRQQMVPPMLQSPLQQVTPAIVAPPRAQPVLPRQQEAPNFFALSPQFAKGQRFAFFRGSGIVLNILSAITIGWLQQNNFLLFGGLIFSLGMFWLCVRIVDKKLALFCGMLIAVYWGFVGWVIGNFLASLQGLDQLLPSLYMGTLFFGVSLGLHIWYISKKNL